MKKFYLLMMFALLGMVANAAEVVTTSTFKSGSSGVNINSDNLTWTISKQLVYLGFDGTRGVQLGSKNDPAGEVTLQTSETFDNVKKIEVYLATGGSASVSTFVGETQMGVATDFSNAATNVYTFEGEPVSGNISFALNGISKALYVQKVVIHSEEAEPTQVAAPTFLVEEGLYYSAQSISLSCATADASIFYTINDGVETAYEAPIELNESGKYTIKAWATKEGLENSEVVSKTYTLKIGEQPMNISLNILEYGTDKGLDRGVDLYEIVYNNVTFVATKGGTNAPKYYEEDWRIYKNGGTLTVTAPDGYLIESIDFVGTINFGSADSGTFKNGKWSALENTQQVVFGGNTGTTKITSITVILKAPNQVAAPTFSLTSGTYEGTQSLTMDCATEGATIYYTVNGGDTQTYADAIELAEGEYAFVAWAEKDGMTKSSEVTANYTIVTPLVANSIAEFLTLGAANTDREITLNCDLTVTYQGGGNDNNRDLYVKDAAGKGLLIFGYQNPLLNNGNIIPAGLKGKLQDYNGLPELVDPSNFGEVSSGDEVSPEVFTAATITTDDLSKYIVLNEVTLTSLDKNKNGTLTDASGDVVIRDNGYCKYPTDVSKEYDVTAVVAIYRDKENKETIQVYPVEIVEHTSSSVNDAVANEFKAVAVANGIEVNVAEAGLVSVYNAAGQLVANVNVAEGATTINVAAGFYIVKAGNNVAKVLVK